MTPVRYVVRLDYGTGERLWARYDEFRRCRATDQPSEALTFPDLKAADWHARRLRAVHGVKAWPVVRVAA